ncbi:RidA family protein [Nocardia sp. NBC_01329]|uniref:RidA family protein n=1 Tax=Nocardia sp. NBC_01329 TaxID=2903594 RepID=UPI002E143B7E|nr:RidA family protein [Nocardia sp. NBC_01329]
MSIRNARIEKIETSPDWYHPYRISQAIAVDGLIYVSGQAGFTEDGRTVEGSFRAQGRQAFRNLERVLAAAGAGLGDIVKVGIFVRDMAANLSEVIELRGEFLSEPTPPTRCWRYPRSPSPTGRSRSRPSRSLRADRSFRGPPHLGIHETPVSGQT